MFVLSELIKFIMNRYDVSTMGLLAKQTITLSFYFIHIAYYFIIASILVVSFLLPIFIFEVVCMVVIKVECFLLIF